ncbi:Calmodulin-binding protein 25 [Rhynchospora pubera]|uniref:Calmodulin-binding protein 25 n=1 Tax=Rhynchospora pubera TaxID=906938 RepID=A0AAV8D981_9POAL|nr:Calmodulin-binding protein 25 [Rhynchospora pubera]KAJ4764380.1 Calmodulin-binding protein 25 [Rhynchospora pubera]
MASMVSWINDALPLQNVELSRALHFSLSETSSSSTASLDQFVLPPEWIGTDLTCPIASDLVHAQTQPSVTGRVAKRKRKSRAMKRNLTTYISTDAANFRQMVQHVTGVGFEFGEVTEVGLEVEPGLVRPEPRRVGSDSMQSSCVLPTLDTSAFLLNQEGLVRALEGRDSEGLVAGPGRDPVFQMDPLNCFPTLESWSVV